MISARGFCEFWEVGCCFALFRSWKCLIVDVLDLMDAYISLIMHACRD